MCDGAPRFREKPEKLMRDLIIRELNLYPDQAALRLFIRSHWEKVKTLAHAIHEEGEEFHPYNGGRT